MSDTVRHPVFARVFTRLSAQAEAAGQGAHRRELLDGLSGRVVEVGAGNGLNFKHYPAAVASVLAVEPEGYLRQRATEEASRSGVPIEVVDGLAEELPVEDESFDVAVASLVLCSVRDHHRALAEMRRVIRPGGELRFYEHVRAKAPRLARFQDVIAPGWRLLAGGCHPNRDTARAIEQAGFTIDQERRFGFRPCALMLPVAPHLLGIARRR